MSGATATRSEERLRVLEVDADGVITMELTHRGRVYTTHLAASRARHARGTPRARTRANG